jgi:uncharacterized protein
MGKKLLLVLLIIPLFSFFLLNISCLSKELKPEDYYEKHEYFITMRDGTKLFTAVYSPRDKKEKYPILMMRTPYSISPYGEKAYPNTLGSLHFASKGEIYFRLPGCTRQVHVRR